MIFCKLLRLYLGRCAIRRNILAIQVLYSAKETYTNAFFHLDYFLSDPFLAPLKTVKEGAAFYGLVDNVFGSPVWALPIVLATGLLALTLDGDHGMRRRLVLLAGVAPFWLRPLP